MRAIEAVLARAGADAAEVEIFAHGMTVGTNALLEERGARTALIATRGFADLLEIGRQDRPRLYRLCAPKPRAADRSRAAASRPTSGPAPRGSSRPLGEEEPERLAALLRERGAEAVAICLLFSYLDPTHERAHRRAPARARCPSVHVSASHEVLPRFREYERCSTTAIDAYLSPLLGRYLGELGEAAERGGPARAAGDAILGRRRPGRGGGAGGRLERPLRTGRGRGRRRPAGPRSAATATPSGSTWAAPPATSAWSRTARSAAPTRARSAAARSSCRWSTSTPSAPAAARSAGATPAAPCGSARARRAPSPGPACYGRGGAEPTVTDANLLLGHLAADSRLAGGVALDAEAAERGDRRPRRARSASSRWRPRPGSSASPTRRWCGRCAWSRSSAASTPAASPCCPSAAPARCTRRRSPPSWASRRSSARAPSGVLSALGLCASERRRDTARTVMLERRRADAPSGSPPRSPS